MIACSIFVYIPGYLFFRSIKFSRFLSLVSAPIATLVGYGLMVLLFDVVGLFTNWAILFFGFTAFSLCLFLASSGLFQGNTIIKIHGENKGSWWNVLLYVGIAFVITGIVYIRSLDGVNSFIPGNDYTTHLNTIRSFMDTGNWSILNGGYYPRGWACFATMVAQSFSVSAPFAANVLNSVIVSVIYPLSMLGFLTCCFEKRPQIVSIGSVCVLAFTAFPWNVLSGSPISPNILGFALVPIALLFLIECLKENIGKLTRLRFVLAIAIFCVSCIFSHPNALFTAVVFAIPYCVYRIATYQNGSVFPKGKVGVVRRIALIVAFLLIVILMWLACYMCPLFASVTGFNWPATASLKEACIAVATLSFIDGPVQWCLMIITAVGILYSLIRRQYLWIVIGFALFCLMYILNVSTDGVLKQVLTGFWYTASRRLSAAATIMGVPILAMGCYAVSRSVCMALNYFTNKVTFRVIAILFSAIFIVVSYFPSFTVLGPTGQVVTPFGYMTDKLTKENAIEDNWILDREEREFLAEVKNKVGNDVVLNLPYDGSAFAYALNDINIYYRNYAPHTDGESILIQQGLCNVANDSRVSDVIEREGIHWLLILDYQGDEYSTVDFDHNEWLGVVDVTDDTSGFNVVLSEGDMRLYEINTD